VNYFAFCSRIMVDPGRDAMSERARGGNQAQGIASRPLVSSGASAR